MYYATGKVQWNKEFVAGNQSFIGKEAILVKEELKRSYKPRVESRVRLSAAMQTEEAVHRQFDALARAPKQLALLMKYIELSGWTGEKKELKEVSRKALLDSAGATSAVLNGLIGKEFSKFTRSKSDVCLPSK